MAFFRSDLKRYGRPIEQLRFNRYPGLPAMDATTRAFYERQLPRGIPIARLTKDRERINYYMSPGELLGYQFEMGQLLIGKIGSAYLGHADDRPLTTIAGTRAGKTSTILEPNLYLYSGSMLVLDPKGELSRAARYRRAMGQNVHVLDPFEQTGEATASFNPLAELDPEDPAILDDVASVSNALVPEIEGGGGNAKHFTDSARTLIVGLILIALTLPERERNLVTVRELLCLTYPPLVAKAQQLQREALAKASKEEKKRYFEANSFTMVALLHKMKTIGKPFGRVAAGIANRLEGTPPTERGGIFSSAAVSTDFIDSLLLQRTLRHSDFRLADLRGETPTTIFLCLSVDRMDRHFRWLRLIVQLTCSVLERLGEYPRYRLPILMMLEEFAALGYMPIMERASAYFPGFGLKPWFVLQDVTQLKSIYRSWDSFLGNSGLVQLFANGDRETIDYISRRLGKLVAPWEIETGYAREHQSQLLLMKGQAPAAALRLSHQEVEQIRQRPTRG
jgi:type IV secretion system protein VirD4